MKKFYLISLTLILFVSALSAQTFQASDTLFIQGLRGLEGEFADLDNDGDFDLLVFGINDSTGSVLPLVLTNTEDIWSIDTLSVDTLASSKFTLSDINNDNKLDLVSVISKDSVHALAIFYQTGILEFNEYQIIDSLYTPYFQVEDMNNDGRKEFIYTYSDSLGYNLKILKQTIGSWEEDTTIYYVPYGPQLIFDFDNNNFKDIFIAGTDSLEQAFSILISNNHDTLSIKDSIFLQLKNPLLTLGDYDHDGQADILGAGIGSDSLFHSLLYLTGNAADSLEIMNLDALGIVGEPDYFMADMNSDGLTDIVMKGINASDSLINMLLLKAADGGYILEPLDTLFSAGTIQRFADLDCDGDLDKVLISPGLDSLGSKVVFYNNISLGVNFPPGLAPKFAAFQQENQILLFWEGVEDDHTPAQSLSHDVIITNTLSNDGVILPSFDQNSRDRLVVRHGNNGYNHEITVRNLPAGEYYYGIQSVDNAFHNSGCFEGGICSGSFTFCDQLLGNEVITACIGETVTLNARHENTGWYSIRKGFLGFSASVSIHITSSDTIYNDASGDIPCFERRRWIITPEKVKLEFKDIIACKNELLGFQLTEAHDSVRWISATKGLLSDSSFMEVTAREADTIRLQVYKSGCVFNDTFSIVINSPKIKLNGAQFKIFAGQEVQLEASGVASYSWSTMEGLNDSTIANPIAAPLKNTMYTVTGIDLLGCVVKDSILLLVEHAAFVATLFTPNNDHKNDALLLFGLEQASHFSFQLYNRSGTLIYETKDVHEATTSGWDGTVNGKPQPNGVYYWKVAGTFPDGKKVLLNGKESGAIHLIR